MIFEIPQSEQHLGDIEPEFMSDLLVCIEEQGHSACSSRLLVGYACALGSFTDYTQAQCHRAGGTDDYVPVLRSQMGDVLHKTLEEAVARC